jgi:hypothetical protein
MPNDAPLNIVQPWDRERGESAKAYASFRRFRDEGPSRSLVGRRKIERRWSYRWRWFERAGSWDDVRWRREDEQLLAALVERRVSA